MLFPYSRSGNCAAHLTCETLTSLRKDAEFAIFWQEVMKQSELDADEPTLPRKCKTPSREKWEQENLIILAALKTTTEFNILRPYIYS